MIPFDKIYSWLFKSFNIHGETDLVENLIQNGYTHMMIIKRSWIFGLFTLWIPLTILCLSATSIWIAYYSISIPIVQNTVIIGNILMSIILVISSLRYIVHFRRTHAFTGIWRDPNELSKQLAQWDAYFVRFFNWSITNQFILFFTIIAEIALILVIGFDNISDHIWILLTDTFVMITEIAFLKKYRKRMMDLEMDYNIIVPGKVFFVNQSGILSSVQTIESDKIKTVRSTFPSKIASFFNYGTVDILTEWDNITMMGSMSMYYVQDPDGVVNNIELLLSGKVVEEQTPKTAIQREKKADTEAEKTLKKSLSHKKNIRSKVDEII